jgi:hypothetical protein
MLYSSDKTPTNFGPGTRVEWPQDTGIASFFNEKGPIFFDPELKNPCKTEIMSWNTLVTVIKIIARNADCAFNCPRATDVGITCELVRANPTPNETLKPVPRRRGKK